MLGRAEILEVTGQKTLQGAYFTTIFIFVVSSPSRRQLLAHPTFGAHRPPDCLPASSLPTGRSVRVRSRQACFAVSSFVRSKMMGTSLTLFGSSPPPPPSQAAADAAAEKPGPAKSASPKGKPKKTKKAD